MCPPFPHLVCCLVDVTRAKTHVPSQGPVLIAIDKQAHNDSWMGRMFGMAELQLQIGVRSVIEDEMATLAECYPLMDSAIYMRRMGLAFQESIDVTVDEDDGLEEDELDDTGLGDDGGDRDCNAASMTMDFATNVATHCLKHVA